MLSDALHAAIGAWQKADSKAATLRRLFAIGGHSAPSALDVHEAEREARRAYEAMCEIARAEGVAA